MDEEKPVFALSKVYETHSVGFYRGWVIVKIETNGYDCPYYAFWPDITLPEEDLASLENLDEDIGDGVCEYELDMLLATIDEMEGD